MIVKSTRRSFIKYAGALTLSGTFLNACSVNDDVDENEPEPILTKIACYGDSLTAGSGGTPYPTQLAALMPDREVINFGISGQMAQSIAARQGGAPIKVTLNNNTFAGDAEVALTPSPAFLSTKSEAKVRSVTGTVGGIKCIITRKPVGVAPNHTEVYTIKPASASTAVIPADSVFISDEALLAREYIQLLWLGRNNAPNFTNVFNLIANCVAQISEPKRFLIIGELNKCTETIGTSAYTAITAMNDKLRLAYPNNFVESTPPTAEELKNLGYTPTAQDLADMEAGAIPRGLHSADTLHLTTTGYLLMVDRILAKLKEKGW